MDPMGNVFNMLFMFLTGISLQQLQYGKSVNPKVSPQKKGFNKALSRDTNG